MSDGPSTAKPDSNVYTVLVIISVVVLLGSTIFLAVRSQSLFGSWNPFL